MVKKFNRRTITSEVSSVYKIAESNETTKNETFSFEISAAINSEKLTEPEIPRQHPQWLVQIMGAFDRHSVHIDPNSLDVWKCQKSRLYAFGNGII